MNTKIYISSVIISSLLLVSCKKELEPQETTATSELIRLGLAKDTTTAPAAAGTVQTQMANPNTVLNDTKGINPAHGQPGHRCDIAVGAPLNSAPSPQGQVTAAPAGQTIQVNPNQTQVVTTTAAPVKTAKGMNPPHGQPGHRCDIPVGAPLNSPAPKTTAATTNTAQSGSVSQNFTVTPQANPVPALLSTEGETKVADGMNPAHGQPGHRCDVAVGAPLPKS
ncbi:hypothetical protein [Flavobacterium hungaricum]|uniref:Uncharacterized protein n=1 Tax=Flavobacterium hungaricum TaxID=2082725 RepID=A0ABR9TJI7_9FLAO|nr:hypothetical protein [Flavobacterium hungaricum]MBE8725187.1 hypothetical protein [Flavobacterium hungaricum]